MSNFVVFFFSLFAISNEKSVNKKTKHNKYKGRIVKVCV